MEGFPPSGAGVPKRKVSAAGHRRVAASTEAQNARWAKLRGESPLQSLPVTSEQQKRKRKTSAAGRKAISEAIERRWALKRAEAQKPQPTASKKAAAKKTAGKKSQKNARGLQSCL
jgi:hypothetical protein